jgi:dihydroorotate dehydrogenase (fumarate)
MADLSCKYLGLDLRNPLIVNSSGLTNNIDRILLLQDSGAGAIILKSLFEEEIEYESGRIIDMQPATWPGADEYAKLYSKENTIQDYLKLIGSARKKVSIPLIASINCYSSGEWIDVVKSIESAGADALELNIFFFPDDKDFRSEDYERICFDIVAKVSFRLNIPVTVRIGPYFTNILFVLDQIIHRGAKGITIFNHFSQPDIDLDSFELKVAENINITSDFYQTLRWINIISASLNNADIAASIGGFNYETVIKLLLCGANVVTLSPILDKNNLGYISEIADGLNNWMDLKGFSKIEQFQGQINYSLVQDIFLYERFQFIKNFDLLQ